jgi:hypothetical protein
MQEAVWVGYWSKCLVKGADPRLVLSQIVQLVETGKVKQGA